MATRKYTKCKLDGPSKEEFICYLQSEYDDPLKSGSKKKLTQLSKDKIGLLFDRVGTNLRLLEDLISNGLDKDDLIAGIICVFN